ncbi:uncharacterized protein JCM6883_006413 [Sporobolomyces salmoneus]|uniref:uncharacterized protein n=1 Tax=Sporobolomyces salmoneus TaxID=183962 RepID=UPI0031740244
MATRVRRLSLPTSVLPKLSRKLSSSNLTSKTILDLIQHLRTLYVAPSQDSDLAHPTEETARQAQFSSEVEEDDSVDPLLHQDQFERSWAVNWLNLVVKRGEEWIEEAEELGDEGEKDLRMEIVDEAAALVSHLTATSEGGAILRPLLLPTCLADSDPQTEPLMITLNDALPSHLDPTSVGLQSWGSSIILARMIALDPVKFGVGIPDQRVLELGAGTGLLSLVWKGMSERMGIPSEVFATDYHDGVLENLQKNVVSNSAAVSPAQSPLVSPSLKPINPKSSSLSSPSVPGTPHSNPSPSSSATSSSSSSLPVQTHKLDWSAVHSSRAFSAASNPRNPIPTIMPPPFDKPFHTLIAADVVYGPTHAIWLKSCVEQFLITPDNAESQAQLPQGIANLSLNESAIPLPLPSRPSLHSTDTSTNDELSTASHVVTTTASGTESPVSGPAFHLIVPLRPTHAEAIASITKVFPSKESLSERKEGEGWRVAIQCVTEIERVKGVGRADEGSYKLFRVGWC